MARLTEEMVIARSKQSDLSAIKKLNCWGAELGDVSLLRRMPNVEVLALSINKIRSLEDFAGCRRLRELYVRKNEIGDLREIRHLRRLPELTSLWLDENPCTDHPEYRMTVLRNLPNLEKLDNVPVHPDEVNEAMRRGHHIADSDDEGYAPQETYGGPAEYTTGGRRASAGSDEQYNGRQYSRVPDQGSDSSEGAEPPPGALQSHQSQSQLQSQSTLTVTCEKREECPMSPTRRYGGTTSPDNDDRYEIPPTMTRSHYEARTVRSPEEPTVRHSVSAHSVKEYSYGSNGDYRHAGERTPPQYQEQYHEHRERDYAPSRCPAESYERERDRDRERDTRERDREREFPSAVMGEHRGFTRRPVTRNSNLLSAVLCLVKELDYPSLEVAEMAVRCRMDELANSQ